jgi:methylated-DNA-protein-cysteine methyltransferase-like protein
VKSQFFQDVYEVVKLIPKGKVTSYGAIARYLGTTKSARVVGWAMNNSHTLNNVPAHRVVNRDGLLTGKNHFPYPNAMKHLLEAEGIKIQNNKIIDFNYYYWNPIKELEL